MRLSVSNRVAAKIWEKDDRRISQDDAQRAWATYMNSKTESDGVIYDTRENRDPPPEWILVKINRKVMKLVFVIFDPDDENAHLITAYYVDRRTERFYEEAGGRIHG